MNQILRTPRIVIVSRCRNRLLRYKGRNLDTVERGLRLLLLREAIIGRARWG